MTNSNTQENCTNENKDNNFITYLCPRFYHKYKIEDIKLRAIQINIKEANTIELKKKVNVGLKIKMFYLF